LFGFIHLTPDPSPKGEGRKKEMDIKQLTEEMNRLVESKGWYVENSKRPQTPRNLAVSLAIEAAEILEHFQFTDEIKDRDELGSELADVTLYLLQLASVSGIDLEAAVLKKIEVNKRREWDQNR
jgi:NTP pyrophosphatase (non-canonical NTP hydrolase)